MKATDYIALALNEHKVSCVFELVGGMITHLVDSFYRNGNIRIVSVHHEQAAAFAADASGRMMGVPGVALATSGPGATNLLTGIGSCYFDSSPAIFITGQVNRSEIKGDRAIRQLGFQETDIVSMAQPITKATWQVRESGDIPVMLQRAFDLATSGRPGPVLLDIPMDVQRGDITQADIAAAAAAAAKTTSPIVSSAQIEEMLVAIREAKRPLILVGGGIRSAQACDLVREFIDLVNVPVVNSLMGVDVLPYSHRLRVGMIGSYGNRWANLAIGQSDFLLVLGSRLDIRQTGSETAAFKGARTIYHVDCEPGEINNRVIGCVPIVADLKQFLATAIGVAREPSQRFTERTEWLGEIATLRNAWPDTAEAANMPGINPNVFLHQLSAASTSASAYAIDVGQHQMWAGQSIEVQPDQRFLTSGGMGSMGFSLPAAIGAACVAAPRPVVVVAGDGGFQCNIQELQTVARNRLPIKIVILNNRCHGMVRQFQQSYFDERYQSTLWGYNAPDYAKVAVAYGLPGHTVSQEADVPAALQWLWEKPDEPALLQVMVDTFINAYPKIAFGKPITEMEPFSKPIEMEVT